MAIGEMQQADIAVARQLVHPGGVGGGMGAVIAQRKAAGRCDTQQLKELTPGHAHVCSFALFCRRLTDAN